MINQTIKPTGCCEPFNPKPWQDPSTGSGRVKEIVWKEKLFVKDHVTSFLHISLDMGKKAIKNMELIKLYFSYTTCPKCAKAYGKNYVVLFAQIN